ncbi:hypothetical protein CPB84DRAFT_294776 [Gymnopilus junonius]|uniref:Uncharacterized protein n=1 Tax=Gymnopilus junonius TaxID=109634 RepID=A0A9P5NXI9_GYMJU|nr:hypothetical protein CPB84DRAFT_294776 [Gymnopilus junonius]
MFKRVEKRRRKKEEEEELGLNEDMKEVLGIQDTDSEESASDTDSEDENNSADEAGEEDEEMEGIGGDSVDEEDYDDEDEKEDPMISVSQALDEPIYVVSVLPEVKSCIVCPGKLLKSTKMVQLHRTSNAHERRFKLLKKLSLGCDRDESAWELLRRHADDKQKLPEVITSNVPPTSKRAERKKAQQARRKIKREKFKARQAAKKMAATTASESKTEAPFAKTPKVSAVSKTNASSKPTTPPPKKKRKVQVEDDTKPTPGAASKETAVGTSAPKKTVSKTKKNPAYDVHVSPNAGAETVSEKKERPAKDISVKSIVRSTTDRAKNARSKALTMSKKSKSSTVMNQNKLSPKKAVKAS